MAFQREYMERAIELARKGIGAVNPNPLVGAVIVKNGRIIGEGYHAKYGELHAERDAFRNLTEDAEGAELYVTLEPCCHYGKQPPCTQAVVDHKIRTVYVGSDDPNDKVAGKGIAFLREQGIHVETRKMKEACDALNDVFFHYITTKTPYVVMKYAMTMDGKIASYTGASQWITGEAAREHVQESRNQLMGIMVGIGTVLADDPSLTCRIANGRNPIRIVCDSHLQIPLDCRLVRSADTVPTLVATLWEDAYRDDAERACAMEKMKKLDALGVTVVKCSEKAGHIDIRNLMTLLGERGIDGILLEGGGTLNYSALQEGVVKEVQVYVAPKILGGRDAKTPVEGQGVAHPDLASMFRLCSIEHYGEDLLLTYKDEKNIHKRVNTCSQES